MEKGFLKESYDMFPGYRLRHTTGQAAGASTLDYLHSCDEYMLIYFLCGSGSIKVEGNHYPIHPGDLIIVSPTELFCCKVDDGTYHERIVIYFNEAALRCFPGDHSSVFRQLLMRGGGIGNRICANSVLESSLAHHLVKLLQLARSNDPARFLLSACELAQALVVLTRAVPEQNSLQPETQTQNRLLRDVLQHLNTHYTEEISLDTVADTFDVHRSYLSHLFKEQMGMSLWHYVILRRLQHCNALIRNRCTAEDACYRSGFQNYANFFRLYKKHMGITPTQYKKQLGL